ncbi:MAG: hypothetical protein ACYSVY_12180 [Planctomycetota bacterium]|jgi:hypothetical protein
MRQELPKPGQRVRIHQEIERREGNWKHVVVGTVLESKPEMTGAWFAHSENCRLWLNRVRLRKDDGEITLIVVDQHTHCEILTDVTTLST